MNDLLKQLVDETLSTSKFEDRRDYISLSNIYKPVEQLLNDFHNGYTANDEGKIKCRLGYHMEAGLKERLMQIHGVEDSYKVVVPTSWELIKGHTDFLYYGIPGDCKSFAMDSYMPKGRVSNKIFWQMNAYMLYMNKYTSVVVAESRESGLLEVIDINRNLTICNQIETKVKEILSRLAEMEKNKW